MRRVIGVAVFVVALVFAAWYVSTARFTSWDFRNNLWAPAYLLWHGSSPYNVVGLFPNTTALWFPQIITIFAPLGLLPLYLATNLWLVINITLLVLLVWHLASQEVRRGSAPLLWLGLALAVVLFPPTVSHLILGQVDLIYVTAILAGTLALEKDRITLAGLLYAIALVKPQLCVLVLPSAAGYLLLIRKDWRSAIQLLLLISIFTLGLTLPLWIADPGWTGDLASNFRHIPDYRQPSIVSLLSRRFGFVGSIVWFVLGATAFALSLRLWSRLRPAHAVLWSMALTTIASPYIWGWDFVLLLPLFIHTAARVSKLSSRVVLFGSLLLCPILTVMATHTANAGNHLLWWIPYNLLMGIALSLKLDWGFKHPIAGAPGRT